jgi:hypothetical protein
LLPASTVHQAWNLVAVSAPFSAQHTSSAGFLDTRLQSDVVLPTPKDPVMMLVGMGSFSFLIAGDTPAVRAAAEGFLAIGRDVCDTEAAATLR